MGLVAQRSQVSRQRGKCMRLIIGNCNYSTWSLRPWAFMTAMSLRFEVQRVSLNAEGLMDRLLAFTPTARVPVLIDGDLVVSDSLAICEYINEAHAGGLGWPNECKRRAQARALVAEMHAGFGALRSEMPMNIRAQRKVDLSEAARRDVQRIDDIWKRANDYTYFEQYSIVDAFYLPVASRFNTYGIKLSEASHRYQQSLLSHPAYRQWEAMALVETEVIAEDEAGQPR